MYGYVHPKLVVKISSVVRIIMSIVIELINGWMDVERGSYGLEKYNTYLLSAVSPFLFFPTSTPPPFVAGLGGACMLLDIPVDRLSPLPIYVRMCVLCVKIAWKVGERG